MHWKQCKKAFPYKIIFLKKKCKMPKEKERKKWVYLWVLSWFFFLIVFYNKLLFIALHSVYQDTSFQLSKSTILHCNLFDPQWGPFWFDKVKIEKWLNPSKKRLVSFALVWIRSLTRGLQSTWLKVSLGEQKATLTDRDTDGHCNLETELT